MGVKSLLKTLNFFQFFIWGTWLVTLATYFFSLGWQPEQFGYIYSTIGLSAIGFPSLFGFLCDRYLNTTTVFRVLHLTAGIIMLFVPLLDNPLSFFWVLLIYMILYMATLPMLISYSYQLLSENSIPVKVNYPKIRVWGTFGFICALWIISLTGNEASVNQFYYSAIASFLLFGISFLMPNIKVHKPATGKSWVQVLGFDVLRLIKNKKLIPFYLLAFFFGVALIVANGYTDAFIHQISSSINNNSILVKYPAILVSVSQISELLFLIVMPYFLLRYSNQKLFVFGFIAWISKFLFLYLASIYFELSFVILSSISYGLAFDFFIVPGSLYLDENTPSETRAGAQGLLVMLVNGFGSLSGSFFSGILITSYFTFENLIQWNRVWFFFTVLIFAVLVLYFLLKFLVYKKTV